MNATSDTTPPVTKEEPVKKLVLFWSSQNQTDFIRERLSNMPDLVNRLGYDFKFQMPSVVHEYTAPEPKYEKYINWRGKERQRLLPQPIETNHRHFLEFAQPLTDEELKFWRIFKLGYLSRDFDPRGTWRR